MNDLSSGRRSLSESAQGSLTTESGAEKGYVCVRYIRVCVSACVLGESARAHARARRPPSLAAPPPRPHFSPTFSFFSVWTVSRASYNAASSEAAAAVVSSAGSSTASLHIIHPRTTGKPGTPGWLGRISASAADNWYHSRLKPLPFSLLFEAKEEPEGGQEKEGKEASRPRRARARALS